MGELFQDHVTISPYLELSEKVFRQSFEEDQDLDFGTFFKAVTTMTPPSGHDLVT